MRAGLATIHQTLTCEAAAVLNQSIAEAARRNHGQATPLHVAATLLSSPTGFLRQACIKSHPNSSHPLQCRALELCFSVALDRLPALQSVAPGFDPPVSNALLAALKRAQAQQRRGCPEQQQQPLLAVKVELEQLLISILDDPSVSRVMKEASFCSPAVKATIEQSLLSTSTPNTTTASSVNFHLSNFNPAFEFRSLGPVPVPVPVPVPGGKNMYINPKLQKPGAFHPSNHRPDEVKKIIDIMSRTKKRNPIVVLESEPEQVVKEVLKKASTELNHTIKIIRLEKDIILDSWVSDIPSSCGVIIDAGDLKWLVEQPSPFVSSGGIPTEAGKKAVAVVGKVLRRNVEGSKVWLIGTATWATYLRCQVYYPNMESDWDLQPFSVTGNFPSAGSSPVKNVNDNLPQWLRKATPQVISPPESPVRTELALGLAKDNLSGKASNPYGVEFVKKMLKAVSWQQDAAESVAATITRCKLGNGKRRGGDIWVLFTGPDVSGKKRMVSAISEVVCGAEPTVVRFGTKRTVDIICRRKTSLDQIVDAIRRNPFSVVLLEDIDEADALVRSSIKRAIETGRLSDSNGREFSLGNVIFILTANWLPDDFPVTDGVSLNEKRLARLRNGDWNLRVSLSEKNAKRHARWLLADRPIKQKKEFDLNEAADDDNSDITADNSEDGQAVTINKVLTSAAYPFSRELVSQMDNSVVFKPVDCVALRRDVASFIAKKFASVMGDGTAVEIEDDALETIVCGVWLGWLELDEWYGTALLRVIRRLKMRIPNDKDSDSDSVPIRVELDDEQSTWRRGDAQARSVGVCAVGF